MKTQILDINGKKIKEITTNLFEEPIREDIIFKVIEAEKIKHPYSPRYRAGMDRSASGNVSNAKGVWKTRTGKGMARIPKKTMWRRGTQFSWVGAIVPSTVGGRRAHPPKGLGKLKKINKKELRKALLSALSYTISMDELKKKYASLKNKKVEIKLPIIIESKILDLKTKEFFESLKKILGELYVVAIQKKTKRAGIGKLRGRKYKKTAGALIVIGNKEKLKSSYFDIVNVNQLSVLDLANGGVGRLTIYTEEAIKDLGEKLK